MSPAEPAAARGLRSAELRSGRDRLLMRLLLRRAKLLSQRGSAILHRGAQLALLCAALAVLR